MKTFLRFSLLSIAVIFIGCNDNNEKRHTQQKNSLVYLAANNDLARFAIDDVAEGCRYGKNGY